jgi:ribosomal-protein-alanine N-acetyltransferase
MPAAGYSNLAIIPANRRLLVLAGQIGNVMSGDILDGIEAQYHQALDNINSIVLSEGGTFKDVARITIFLTEKPDNALIKESNKQYFSEQPPAMSWIYVSELFRPDVKVEIEAIAAVN